MNLLRIQAFWSHYRLRRQNTLLNFLLHQQLRLTSVISSLRRLMMNWSDAPENIRPVLEELLQALAKPNCDAYTVARIIAEHGYKVGNIDATILCQRPKLAPHIPAMRRNIADAFGLPVDAVSVKATTEEHLGFTGEGLGIAAHAVALIE